MKEYLFEPDRIEFDSNNLKCVIKRHHMGFLLAYVFLPKHNVFFGKEDHELNTILKNKVTEISYTEEQPDGTWAVGIDFGHINDFVPYEQNSEMKILFNKMAKSLGFSLPTEKDYKTINYAMKAISDIAEQLNKSVN